MRVSSPTFHKEVLLWLTIFAAAIAVGALGAWKGFAMPLGALLALILMVTIINNLKFGLTLLICSYFYVRPILYIPFSNLTYLRVDDVIWLLVVLAWILNIGKQRTAAFRMLPLGRSIFVFSLIALFSVFRAAMVSNEALALQNSIWFLFRLLQYASVYFVFGTIDLPVQERSRLFSVMLFCGLIVALISLLQYGGILPGFAATRYVASEGPLSGTFTFKAHIGAVMMVLILLITDKMAQHRFNQLVGLIMLGIFSVVLVFTQSRSSWLGTLLSIAVYLLILRRTSAKIYWLFAFVCVGIVVVGSENVRATYEGRPILDFSTGQVAQDAAVQSRLYGYSASLRHISEHPDILFLGVGFMNWRYALYPYSLMYSGHNNYLTALGELGLVGLLGFCNLLIQAAKAAWRQVGLDLPYTRFYLSLLAGLAVAACFEDILWPAVALESFFAFFMMISAISLPLVPDK